MVLGALCSCAANSSCPMLRCQLRKNCEALLLDKEWSVSCFWRNRESHGSRAGFYGGRTYQSEVQCLKCVKTSLLAAG